MSITGNGKASLSKDDGYLAAMNIVKTLLVIAGFVLMLWCVIGLKACEETEAAQYTKNRVEYIVSETVTLDAVTDGDGAYTSAEITVFGIPHVAVIPDDIGNAIYSGNAQPSAGAVLTVYNQYSQEVSTYTLTSNAKEYNFWPIDSNNGTLLYFRNRAMKLGITGGGATKKYKIIVSWSIQ